MVDSRSYLRGMAGRRLRVRVAGIDGNAHRFQRSDTQNWRNFFGTEDDATRSDFAHEFDLRQAEGILVNTSIGKLVAGAADRLNIGLRELGSWRPRVGRTGVYQEQCVVTTVVSARYFEPDRHVCESHTVSDLSPNAAQ